MKIIIGVQHLTGGGAERVAVLWATGFVQHGHDVVMVLSENRNRPSYPLPESVRIKNIGFFTHEGLLGKIERRSMIYLRPIIHKKYFFRLKKILKEERPDVFIGVMHPWGFWAKKALTEINYKCPVIQTEHNAFDRPDVIKKEYDYKFIKNRIVERVTVLTSVDKQLIGNRLKSVSVLPNPLPFEPAKEIPKKDKIILAVGRIDVSKVKGFDLLIKAWAAIVDKHSGWKLHIVGGGKTKSFDKLFKMAKEGRLTNKNFELHGRSEDMKPLYKRASIFVLSSRYEGFGLALIEAMSQGCACIACDYNGRQSEIITNKDEGMTVPTENVEALAAAIDKMINDNDYRLCVQQGGIRRSNYYSIQNTMERWNEIFKEMKLI